MNEINFLPPSYLRKQRRSKRVFGETIVLVGVGACLIAWTLAIRSSSTALVLRMRNLETQLVAAGKAVEEAEELETRNRQLHQQLAMQRELVPSVSQSQVLAAISQLLPGSATLTEVRVAVSRRAPEPHRSREELAKEKARTSKRKETAAPKPEYVELGLQGVAADENDVADFLGALSNYPIFAGSKVHYSRSVEFLQLSGRDFRISVRVPLDREYRPKASEVADAH